MKFSYNNRIIEQLGTELITSNEVAITEITPGVILRIAKVAQLLIL